MRPGTVMAAVGIGERTHGRPRPHACTRRPMWMQRGVLQLTTHARVSVLSPGCGRRSPPIHFRMQALHRSRVVRRRRCASVLVAWDSLPCAYWRAVLRVLLGVRG